jgi:hypothetical protein
MNSVRFQNIEFKIREIDLPQWGNVLISITGLNEKLMSEGGSYVSEIANVIDDQIFYYVDETQIVCSEEELIQILTLELR